MSSAHCIVRSCYCALVCVWRNHTIFKSWFTHTLLCMNGSMFKVTIVHCSVLRGKQTTKSFVSFISVAYLVSTGCLGTKEQKNKRTVAFLHWFVRICSSACKLLVIINTKKRCTSPWFTYYILYSPVNSTDKVGMTFAWTNFLFASLTSVHFEPAVYSETWFSLRPRTINWSVFSNTLSCCAYI